MAAKMETERITLTEPECAITSICICYKTVTLTSTLPRLHHAEEMQHDTQSSRGLERSEQPSDVSEHSRVLTDDETTSPATTCGFQHRILKTKRNELNYYFAIYR